MKIGFSILISLLLTLLSLASVAGYCSLAGQAFELASHFRYVYAIAFIPCLLALALLRFWKGFAVGCICFAVNAIPMVDMYLPQKAPEGKVLAQLGVLQFNLWGPKNTQYDKVIALVKEKSPDVIGFSEITETWEKALIKGLPEYKYRTVEKRYGGVGFFSKNPMIASQIQYYGEIKRPRIEAHLIVGKYPVTFVFMHPVIPKHMYVVRNGELITAGDYAGRCEDPVVLFGDLNCSPWSYYFTKVLDIGRLHDTEKGFGVHPTWTTQWIFPLIPIDHCLVSKEFFTRERTVGPDIGSDHLPVFVKLEFHQPPLHHQL